MPRDFIDGKGASRAPDLIEINNLDTRCDNCFAPADKVYYNKDRKTLLVVCSAGHEFEIPGDWEGILGLE